MKLDIQNVIGNITAVRSKIGAKLNSTWKPDFTWPNYDPYGYGKIIDEVGEVEVEDLEQFDYPDDGTIELLGRKVLVYIRDRKQSKGMKYGLPKFHIANCTTLQEAKKNNCYGKYVASTKTDGNFIINVIGDTVTKTVSRRLEVCKNCLERLNYKGYKRFWRFRDEIYDNFSIKDFFDKYKKTDIRLPKYNDTTAPINDYPKDFDIISKELKRVKNYTCERCGENLRSIPECLHVHHKNRRKDDNRFENLTVLCAMCHSEEGSDHANIRNTPLYK